MREFYICIDTEGAGWIFADVSFEHNIRMFLSPSGLMRDLSGESVVALILMAMVEFCRCLLRARRPYFRVFERESHGAQERKYFRVVAQSKEERREPL